MPYYARGGKTDEVTELRDEITHEVNTDAEHLARQVFPRKGKQPDMQRVSTETLDARYRQAYISNDRQWLTSEAQRDPEQFIEVVRRIGVMLPEEIGQGSPLPSLPATGQPMAPELALPPPQGAPAPVSVPVLPAPPGLPLPGAVATPGQPVPMTVPTPGII